MLTILNACAIMRVAAVVVHRGYSNHNRFTGAIMANTESSRAVAQSQVSEVEYRDIPGFPGYRVGNDGSIWSWVQKRHVWKPLKGGVDKDGYKKIILCNHGKRRYARVHILVLEAFSGPCPHGMEACHGPDNNRANNRIDNLRWDIHLSNIADKRKHGTHQEGEKHGCAKLTAVDIQQIRALRQSGVSLQVIAERFGTTKSHVCAIAYRHIWKCVL